MAFPGCLSLIFSVLTALSLSRRFFHYSTGSFPKMILILLSFDLKGQGFRLIGLIVWFKFWMALGLSTIDGIHCCMPSFACLGATLRLGGLHLSVMLENPFCMVSFGSSHFSHLQLLQMRSDDSFTEVLPFRNPMRSRSRGI